MSPDRQAPFPRGLFFEMNADLERLIQLQRLDSAAMEAQQRLAEEPERQKAFDARMEVAGQRVTDAKTRLADNQTARRNIEKDVAVHQGRLSKFSDQLMAVKTNVEYQAMQKEIGFAKGEVKELEDKILERMIEADELNAALKRAETTLASEQKAVDAETRALVSDLAEKKAALERIAAERAAIVAGLNPKAFATFDLVSKRRNGVALAEARDEICTICHVRMRPQVFNNVRRNNEIIQCDSCNRILYFVPIASAATATEPAP
jgi:predicted  nucleic acid-binding Zn-ribbon protein